MAVITDSLPLLGAYLSLWSETLLVDTRSASRARSRPELLECKPCSSVHRHVQIVSLYDGPEDFHSEMPCSVFRAGVVCLERGSVE